MACDTLKVLPLALQAASGIIAGHAAQVAPTSGSLGGTAESSGVAAAAMHGAFNGYRAAFAQRLESASAALVAAAGSFTATEDTNSRLLASIAPVLDGPVSEV